MKRGVLICLAAAAGVVSAPAWSQATRTWVSGVGDDANPCSRTAPCKTFAGTISKTASAGSLLKTPSAAPCIRCWSTTR